MIDVSSEINVFWSFFLQYKAWALNLCTVIDFNHGKKGGGGETWNPSQLKKFYQQQKIPNIIFQ